MRKVIIYSGLPGSGKSFIANCHYAAAKANPRFAGASIYSTDNYFIDNNSNYNFDPTKIGEAHSECFTSFTEDVISWWGSIEDLYGRDVLILVDNTNLSVAELTPYVMVATSYGFEAEIITVKVDPDVAFNRNTHGVPRDVFDHMVKILDSRELPPWWNHSEIVNE